MPEKIKRLENELFPNEESIESEESSWMNRENIEDNKTYKKNKILKIRNKKLFFASSFPIKKILSVDYAKINNFNKNNAQNLIFAGRKNIYFKNNIYGYETSIDSIFMIDEKILFISKHLPFIFDFSNRKTIKNLKIGKRADNLFFENQKLFIANEKLFVFSLDLQIERIFHLPIKNIIYMNENNYAIMYENKIGILNYASEKIEILCTNIFKFYGMIFYAHKNYIISFLNNSIQIFQNKKMIKKISTGGESKNYFLKEKYLFFIEKNHLRIFDCEKLIFVDLRRKISASCFFIKNDDFFCATQNKIFSYSLFTNSN